MRTSRARASLPGSSSAWSAPSTTTTSAPVPRQASMLGSTGDHESSSRRRGASGRRPARTPAAGRSPSPRSRAGGPRRRATRAAASYRPRLVEWLQAGVEPVVGGLTVHPALEAAAQLEHVRDDVLAVAGEAELLADGVHHLLRRRHAGRGEQHEEGDAIRLHGGDRPDPGTLADAPEPGPLGADRVEHRERVARLHVEAAARRVARRLALAAAVEGDDADARRRQQPVQVP